MARCHSCKAEIEWAVTEYGKRMPIDAEPVPEGTIVLSHRRVGEAPVAVVQTADELEEHRKQHDRRGEELRLFVSHFTTCPDAARHRGRGDDDRTGEPLPW